MAKKPTAEKSKPPRLTDEATPLKREEKRGRPTLYTPEIAREICLRLATGAVDAVLRTVAGYAFLVWFYLCVNSLTHPYTLRMRLTHFAAVPTEGTAAVSCFLLSLAAFLVLRLRELWPNGEA